MGEPLRLSPMLRITPTLWGHLRACSLRALLSTCKEADRWVLHDPRAWLGVAFHRLMESAAARGTEASLVELWDAVVADAAAKASTHVLDARFARPDRWPGYFLVRQRALAAAQRATTSTQPTPSVTPRSSVMGAERRLVARAGRLAGRPDQYDGQTITEFKSSLPEPSWPGAQRVLERYRSQVRLYAVMIAEMSARWPKRGRIVAASGETIEVPLLPAECEQEADIALEALDSANAALSSSDAVASLATPSENACSDCSFQALCPAFWKWLSVAQLELGTDVAAECLLRSVDVGSNGDIYTANLTSRHASRPIGAQQALALRKSVHGDHTSSAPGSEWRIVSARVRSDGRLQADIWTVVLPTREIPELSASRPGTPSDAQAERC